MLNPDPGKSKCRLAKHTWREYHERAKTNPIVILPAGSMEQHGPHLPLNTDALLGLTLAEQVAATLSCFVMEPLLYGTRSDPYSGGGEGFPGTVSLRPETFLAVATDVLDQCALDGLRRFVLLNAHYENAALLREASRRLCSRYRDAKVLFCNWWDIPSREAIVDLYPSGTFPGMELEHAGLLETSMMLHLFPESVRDSLTFPDDLCRPPGFETFPERAPSASASGALAPARQASAKIGAELCRLAVEGIVEAARGALSETPS